MSKINDLIKKLCPNGVEYKTIKETFHLFSGMTGVSNKWADVGNCQFIDYMNAYKNNKINIKNIPYATVKNLKQNELKKGDLLLTSASEVPDECAVSSVIEDDIQNGVFMDDHLFGLRLKEEYSNKINTTFINYYLNSKPFRNNLFKAVRGVTRFYISNDNYVKLLIPIPPIEVQEEIVRILDKFDELEAELEAELEVRKSQYEFWLGKLMKLENGVYDSIPLSDVYDFKYGTGNTIPDIGGIYPVYGSNGIVGTHNEWNSEDAPVIGHIGAYAGIVNWAHGKHFVTYNGVICKKINDNVDVRYAYYLLRNQNFLGVQKGAQPFVSYDALKKPIVKIPDIKEQKRIATLLDNFDTLVNSISEGLPAEIELRRQQYEYYRNKLLSFEGYVNE